MAPPKEITTAAPRRPGLVLLAASLGVLIAQIDTSVVSLAVKRIGADLGSTVSGMQWMMDAYNVVYAALLLTGGALGDLYGRRRIFVAGVVLFALGSIACALAPTTAILLAGRAVSGLGAALELPMTLVLLAVAYPDSKARQHALGIWAACNGLAFIVGPTVGGLLVDTAGWRSIFYLILPLCAAALALAHSAVPESASPEGRRLDLPGQAAAIAALGGLSFLAIEGAHLGWASAPVLAAAVVTGLGAIAFVLVERGNARGLVPFEVFRSRPFSAALAIAGLMTFGMYALLFLMPLYFQTLLGDSPLMAGMAAMGAGELVLAFVSRDAGPWLVPGALAIVGVGLGLNTAPVNSVAVANVARERGGTASGLVNTARMVGATLGIAILGAIFAHFAGQSGAAEGLLEGLRPALALGAAAEFSGAVIAIAFITRHSGDARA
jgi:MFS transporter, DHA2 family, methylenomycin A resistance protein